MLPKLNHPSFVITIPSNKKKVSFRPYTVREQKILLLMQELESVEELSNLILQLIESCCLNTDFKIDSLTYFDIEYIFLKIRAKSVGEESSISLRCNNHVSEEKVICGQSNSLKINLDEVEVSFESSLPNLVKLTDDIHIQMKYPSIVSAKLLEEYNNTKNMDKLFQAIMTDLEYVSDESKNYDDFSQEELNEFLYSLDLSSLKNILEFYINSPKLKKVIDFTCTKCGYNDIIVLSGLVDFFG